MLTCVCSPTDTRLFASRASHAGKTPRNATPSTPPVTRPPVADSLLPAVDVVAASTSLPRASQQGSLIANMIMGVLILKKKYTTPKVISVFMITAGIVLCTIVSGKDVKATHSAGHVEVEPTPDEQWEVYFWWVVGIILLTLALFLSARMSVYQEELYMRYGKHPWEALYYTHLLPMPGFLLIYQNISSHIVSMAASSPILIAIIGVTIPKMYLYLAGNVLSQYLCISSVYVLMTECSSLTFTLVLTLRKFISLLFSIVVFKNEFTAVHWIGTLLVFSGTIVFTEIATMTRNFLQTSKANSPLPKTEPKKEFVNFGFFYKMVATRAKSVYK